MSKKILSYLAILALLVLAVSLQGCGTHNGGSSDVTVSNQVCINCHSSTTEFLSGRPIVADYEASGHAQNAHGPSCQTCHGNAAAHVADPAQVQPPIPMPTYQVCAQCHNTLARGTIVDQFSSSKHNIMTTEARVFSQPCNRCHTHNGAVLST
ncbi:MAG: cytochrome C, partial [Desulfuromonadales bacterium]|nr:cytochrome C [Desulfuromonadales bacterium]